MQLPLGLKILILVLKKVLKRVFFTSLKSVLKFTLYRVASSQLSMSRCKCKSTAKCMPTFMIKCKSGCVLKLFTLKIMCVLKCTYM